MAETTTKACNLTEKEVMELMRYHGMQIYPDSDIKLEDTVERIKYFSSRLKAFREAPENAPKETAPAPADPELLVSNNGGFTQSEGWGNKNG